MEPTPGARPAPDETMQWLAALLRSEGVDLLSISDEQLRRGTPVYVHADADVLEVQRVMARNHIRMVPVLSPDGLVGIVDLVDLAQRDLFPGAPVVEMDGPTG